jgi:hypothetical protein
MKRLLPALLLLVSATPLLAQDDGGDGTNIPSYRELVREGYGPRDYRDSYYMRLNYGIHDAPKPTQAFYGKGYTIYYGYTMVPVAPGQEETTYAFGYPLSYFRSMMPSSVNNTNINQYAVEVRGNAFYQPGDYLAQQRRARANAVSRAQRIAAQAKTPTGSTAGNTPATPTPNTAAAATTGTAPLPPIAEKPSP